MAVNAENTSLRVNQSRNGFTPLCTAVEGGHKDLVVDLVRLGADVNLISNNVESAMALAAQTGNMDMVKLLLGFGASVHRLEQVPGTSHPPRSPMHSACGEGHLDVVKFLQSHGADINESDTDCGYSAMMLAAENNRKDVVLYLIEQGADYEHLTHNHKTAMDAALEEGFTSLYFAMQGAIEIREIRMLVRELDSVQVAQNEACTPI